MQRWRRLCLVVVLLAVPACGGSKPPKDHTDLHPEETAVLPSVPPTTAPPTTPALGEQVTTVEAAQRLLDLFAHLDGEAARMLLAKGAPDAEFDQALKAVYVGQALETVRGVFGQEAQRAFFGYARPQPDPIFGSREIIDARREDCVVVSGTLDLRRRYVNPVDAVEGIFVLVMETGISPTGSNPTRWRIFAAGSPAPDEDPKGICPRL